MTSQTKLGLWALFLVFFIVAISKIFLKSELKSPIDSNLTSFSVNLVKAMNLEQRQSTPLEEIVQRNIGGIEGTFAVSIESIDGEDKYEYNLVESFPSASLYKLVLMASVMKEIEAGNLKLTDRVSATKSHLTDILGEVDFGYEEAPEELGYTVEEAMSRVGRISDNFAAIMLTEKVRRLAKKEGRSDPLTNMTQELGMKRTSFNEELITTTVEDINKYFKALYQGFVVSPEASEQIIKFLSLSQLNNRIPAQLPKTVKVVHKTGELARLRHDGGIVYLEGKPYIIVVLTKDLKYEDDGIETIASISKDVYTYFKSKITPSPTSTKETE